MTERDVKLTALIDTVEPVEASLVQKYQARGTSNWIELPGLHFSNVQKVTQGIPVLPEFGNQGLYACLDGLVTIHQFFVEVGKNRRRGRLRKEKSTAAEKWFPISVV